MYFLDDRFSEVNIEVTNACNFDCWFCPRMAMTRDQGFMDVERFKELILNLHRADFLKEIAIAGIGEPTLHPDLTKMISFIKKSTPFKVVLTTNASKFHDTSFAEELFATNVDKITVSLRISDPTKNTSSLPSHLDYERYVRSILNLVDMRGDIEDKTEIELAFLKETYYSKYVLGINARDFIDNMRLNAFFRELSNILDRKLSSYDEYTGNISSHLSNVERIRISDGISVRFDSLSSWTTAVEKFGNSDTCYPAKYGSCLGMLTHFAIYWNGEVSTCCADFDAKNRLGNIFEEKDIRAILSNKKSLFYAENLRKRRMPTSTCQICRGGKTRKEKWANIFGTLLYVK